MNLTASEKAVITVVTAILSAVVAFVPSWNSTAQTVIGLLPTLVVAAAFLFDEIEKSTDATAGVYSALTAPKSPTAKVTRKP